MYGDYSRGHEPDRKRGRSYRRVLLQQGRPVLDSDVAASVDALLAEVRATTRALGCAAGSPDLGLLVTPGRLLSVFAEAPAAIAVAAGTPDAWIDYRFRYAGRYPALYVAGAGGAAGRVTLPLVQPVDASVGSRMALWARVETATTIEVNGTPVSLNAVSPDVPQRVEFDAGGAALDPLEIEVGAGEAAWLFLLEQDEDAGLEPVLWVAPGSYLVDGLVVDARGGAFPDVSFPEDSGFPWTASPQPDEPPLDGLLAPDGLAAGTQLVAYLEAHERHITHVEDPGIREEALGPYDTCARTELLGQVKLAALTGVIPADPAEVAALARAAFADVEVSNGLVTIAVPESTPTTDPCDLPDVAGYAGADNRLYRVEVHRGGGLSGVRLKWSRDNGSELFAARQDESGNLVFDAGTPLVSGDIVEVLSHVVDLGDDELAEVSAGGFVPPRRAVGQLVQLLAVQMAGSSDEVAFSLVDPDDITSAVELDDRYGDLDDAVLKLRRWHGILDPQQIAGVGAASPGPHVLEDGITVELSSTGSYRPGQWWQYEARVARENANGPWRPAPHGPERRFAPLALLEHQGPGEPLLLVEWLDERFSHPCDLDADDVEFAGERVGSASDTVQEALEELFEQPPIIVDSSCGELIVRPENDLQAVFDTIPQFGSARLCMHPGTWTIDETVEVEDKGDLIISGAGAATRLEADGIDAVLRFTSCGRVRIQDLTIVGGQAGTSRDGLAGALALISSRALDLERVTITCGGAPTRRLSAVEVRSGGPAFHVPEVRVRDCQVQVGNAQVGLLLVNAAAVDIQDNFIICPQDEWPLGEAVADQVVAGRVGRLLLDDFVLGETELATDELLVGSNDVLVETEPAFPLRRFIVHLEDWGNQFITFSTALQLNAAAWRQVFDANPIPGSWPGAPAPDGFILSNLRRLRRGLVATMFGGIGATVPAEPRAVLDALADELAAQNAVTAGGQGIVLGGRGTPIDTRFPEPSVLTGDNRPHARISGNKVLGFVQGIHVGTSDATGDRGMSHRVTVADNLVELRVPSLAPERHGIYVGSVFHLRIHGNSVELRAPDPTLWDTVSRLDAIHVYGTFGPLIQVRENSCIGTRNGVVANATNPALATAPGWRWSVTDNAHVGPPGGQAEQDNW